jgi:hypothetical protein
MNVMNGQRVRKSVSLLRMQAPSPLKAAKISTTSMVTMKAGKNRTSTAPMAHQPQRVVANAVPAAPAVRVVLVAVVVVDAVAVQVDRDADPAAVVVAADRSK